MSENRKIKNASAVFLDGIYFRSPLESKMYGYLIEAGYSPEYEPDKFTLWQGFRSNTPNYIDGEPTSRKVRGKNEYIPILNPFYDDWEYTPDFKLSINGYTFYIEVKGYPNDLWPYKKKLFLKLIENDPKTFFFEVKTKRGLLKTLKIIKSIYEQENTNPDNGGTVMQPS